MGISFLLNPIRALRARKLRAQLKAEAQKLQERVAATLENSKVYKPYTRYGAAGESSRRERLKKTRRSIVRYLERQEYIPADRKRLNHLRGDFTEADRGLNDAITQDQHWCKWAERLDKRMRISRIRASRTEVSSLAQELSCLQTEFQIELSAIRKGSSKKDIEAALEGARLAVRDHVRKVKRACTAIKEFPKAQSEFDRLELSKIAGDPQAIQTYERTRATLENIKQKIAAGYFIEAQNRLNAVRANIFSMQTLASRTDHLVESQIRIWLEHADAHPAFYREFGAALDVLVHEPSSKRNEEWRRLAPQISEWATARAGATWDDDRIAARKLNIAFDLPWPRTISEVEDAAVLWKDLINYCEAVANHVRGL
jgi:hypothetical protein